jgi:deoxyribose-phosphate aldolase
MSQSRSDHQDLDRLVPLIAERVKKRLIEKGLAEKAAEQAPKGGACSGGTRSASAGSSGSGGGSSYRGPASGPPNAGAPADAASLARYIDHTLLKADATREELNKLCDEARQYHFFSVCVNSSNVAACRKRLEGSGVKAIAVVGFPLGAMTTEAKAFETSKAIEDGAEEIDMVINIGSLKAREYGAVLHDIASVVRAAGERPVKVILETGVLNAEEKIIACALSKVANAAFVKTSTGFNTGGATVEDIALMRKIVGSEMGVKASGGVRNTETALAMIRAGANRIGASASVAIVTGKATPPSKGY